MIYRKFNLQYNQTMKWSRETVVCFHIVVAVEER